MRWLLAPCSALCPAHPVMPRVGTRCAPLATTAGLGLVALGAGTGAGGVGGTGRSAEEPKQLQVGACSGLVPSGSCSPGKGRDGRQ